MGMVIETRIKCPGGPTRNRGTGMYVNEPQPFSSARPLSTILTSARCWCCVAFCSVAFPLVVRCAVRTARQDIMIELQGPVITDVTGTCCATCVKRCTCRRGRLSVIADIHAAPGSWIWSWL
jgi:hypothetical protein